MTVRPDTLRRDLYPERLAYANGMLLDDRDLTTEQGYHRDRLARLARYLLGYGTAAGLDVSVEAGEAPRLVISPGLAIDRIGRLVEAPQHLCLRLDRWFADRRSEDPGLLNSAFNPGTDGDPDHVLADIFIGFRECETAKRPAFATGNFDALDAVAPQKLRDVAVATLILRTTAEPPLPVTEDFAPTGGGFAARLRSLDTWKREEGWREDLLWSGIDGGLNPGPEHLPDQNPADIFLARVTIPAIAGDPPDFNPSVASTANNRPRRYAYSTAELLALVAAGS